MSAISAWLAQHIDSISSDADVLDIACGSGRHIMPLLEKGCQVWAVDRDIESLASIWKHERLHSWAWDVEACGLPRRLDVDVVLAFNYLHRPVFASLANHIRKGGLLLHETFHVKNRALNARPRRQQFCWENGEAEVFFTQHGFEVIECHDGIESEGRWLTQVLAKKT